MPRKERHTKEERLSIYKLALKRLIEDNDPPYALCLYVERASFDLGIKARPYKNKLLDFPELRKFKPKKNFIEISDSGVEYRTSFWFDQTFKHKRIEILEAAIKMLEDGSS